MISRPFTFSFLLLFTVSAYADEPATVKHADEASTVKLAGYHLANRSTFNAPDTVRPPFWPIGWVHRAKGGPQAPVITPTLTPDMFAVTSILMGRPSLVTINGRSYAEGEFIRTPRRGDNVKAVLPAGIRARVTKIADGSVTLSAGDQTITVSLRRAELNGHKEEELLNSDDPPPAVTPSPAVTTSK
jgi:hypothetical protein